MTRPLHTYLVLGALALLCIGNAQAADPKLMRLLSVGEAPVLQYDVVIKPGLESATSAAPRSRWKFLPGDAVSGAQRPGDRVIDIYTGTLQAATLLCRIAVRYFPSGEKWVPYFLLIEEPAVIFKNGRWQPVQIGRGSALLVQHGNALQNAEGFFPTLELGMTTGPFAIVAWAVR